jgi:homoserine kinase type II
MAVLTSITDDNARALLAAYPAEEMGDLRRVEGVAGGSVNSNFALETARGRLFLRLYEERDLAGARAETAMLERLASAGVPTPAPLRRIDGALVAVVKGKPAALFPWREGAMRCQSAVTPSDVRRVGEALARVHVAAREEACDGGRFRFADLLERLSRIGATGGERFASLGPSLRASLERAHTARDTRLPRGLTHGDLFRDNVLWNDRAEISALLDFESACDDTYAYDLTVTILSWCVGDRLDPKLATALRLGYEGVRPLSPEEKRGLHAEACFAALRFTLTRITDYAMRSTDGAPRVLKDWTRFLDRFRALDAMGPAGWNDALGL